MITEEILNWLNQEKDEKFGDFQARLIPDVERERILGVRTPVLRRLAKEYARREDIGDFLAVLPHGSFDEMNLHGLILAEGKDYGKVVAGLDALLPHVDNWATCDLISPRVFRRHRKELAGDIERYLSSGEVYTVRFGVEMVMTHFLDGDFEVQWLERVAGIQSEEYYVNMMLSWFFATALAKQWEATLPYVTERRLSPWVHNKTIQKAVESRRISDEQKNFLRAQRWREES